MCNIKTFKLLKRKLYFTFAVVKLTTKFFIDIKEILQRLSIGTVLEHYGLNPNRNKMVCCPFHDDKNPSMQVYAETNTVFCFSGNCKMNGKKIDAIQFIQDKESCTKHEAIKKAESLLSITNEELRITKPIIQPENLTEIFPKLKQSLYSSSKARAYAESRNIYNAKLEAGYNKGTHYNKLKCCIIFPLKDKQNNIVSFYGRNTESKGKDDRHFYTANRSGLYPNYPSQETETILKVRLKLGHKTKNLTSCHVKNPILIKFNFVKYQNHFPSWNALYWDVWTCFFKSFFLCLNWINRICIFKNKFTEKVFILFF